MTDHHRSTSHKDMHEKQFFFIFIPNDLDLRPLVLKLSLTVTRTERYISTKFDVSTAF